MPKIGINNFNTETIFTLSQQAEQLKNGHITHLDFRHIHNTIPESIPGDFICSLYEALKDTKVRSIGFFHATKTYRAELSAGEITCLINSIESPNYKVAFLTIVRTLLICGFFKAFSYSQIYTKAQNYRVRS